MLYRCLLSPMCPLSSNKLEGRSVVYSVVDKLLVECFTVLMDFLFPRLLFVWRCPFLVHSA